MRIIALVSTLLLIACAGTPPSHTHYLLRADLPDQLVRVLRLAGTPLRVPVGGRVAVDRVNRFSFAGVFAVAGDDPPLAARQKEGELDLRRFEG